MAGPNYYERIYYHQRGAIDWNLFLQDTKQMRRDFPELDVNKFDLLVSVDNLDTRNLTLPQVINRLHNFQPRTNNRLLKLVFLRHPFPDDERTAGRPVSVTSSKHSLQVTQV